MPLKEQQRHIDLARELIELAVRLPSNQAERQIATKLRVFGATEVKETDPLLRAVAYLECADIATRHGAHGISAAIRALIPDGVTVTSCEERDVDGR